MSTRAHRIARVATLGAVAGLIALVLAGPASAHAGLGSSDPAAGATLPQAPSRITLTFTEPPDPGLSSISVVNAAGQPMGTGPFERGSAPRSLSAPLTQDLPDGVYTVSWEVVSEADGHQTAGAFAFGVGVAPGDTPAPAPPDATSGPSAASVLARVALYLGIVLAIGTAVSGLWTIGPALPGRRGMAIVAGASAILGAILMTLAERSMLGVSLGALLSSSTGRTYLWLLGAATALSAIALWCTGSRGRAALGLMGAAAVATAAARAMGGHAAAADPAWPQELAQTVHIAAIGIWIGGFVPILILVRRARHAGDRPPIDAVRRFSRAAGWAVLVIVATGVLRVIDEAGGLGSVRDLMFDTSYGTALLIKIGLVLILIGLGAYNRRRSIPRMNEGKGLLTRVISVEIAGAVAVLATTAVLTGLNPSPPPAGAAPGPAGISATGSDFATTTRVRLTVTPGSPGPNRFEADVEDFDTGEPAVATAVSLTFEPVGRPQINESRLDLRPSEAHTWVGDGTQLSLAGVWNVTALVVTGARSAEVPLTLATAVPGGQTTNVVRQDQLPDIVTMTFADGNQLQCYVDPADDELHVTAFDGEGQELPLDDILAVATPDGGDPQVLDSTRFGAGHFTADVDGGPGTWRFDVVATGKDGAVLHGSFELEL